MRCLKPGTKYAVFYSMKRALLCLTIAFSGCIHGAGSAFVIRLYDVNKISQARTLISTSDKVISVGGTVVNGGVSYNPTWSFSLDPASIYFFEIQVEVCDGTPEYVEENLIDWVGKDWCPWS